MAIFRQLLATLTLDCPANVFPYHPMWFHVLSAVARIESSSDLIGRLHVNADPVRIMGDEPFS